MLLILVPEIMHQNAARHHEVFGRACQPPLFPVSVVKEVAVKTFRLSLTFITALCLSSGGALVSARGASSTAARNDLSAAARQLLLRAHGSRASAANARHLSPSTLRELAKARRATAKYHDVANA